MAEAANAKQKKRATTTRSTSASSRLGVEDWIRAALDVMAEDGVKGVTIQRLCQRLGVTIGSFYWHFSDMEAFRDEVAKRWFQDGLPASAKFGPDSNPQENLLTAMKAFSSPRNRNIARAMRDWSETNEGARSSTKAVDERMFELLLEAFESMGFSAEDADLRARVLYYTGVGFDQVGKIGSRESRRADFNEALLALLTRR